MSKTRRGCLERGGALGLALVGGPLGGCIHVGVRDQPRTTVRVGSKPFAEQEILGYLAYEQLQQVDGIQVVNEIGYGGSLANWEAVVAGTKDLYWEYTGTAWSRLPPRHTERITEPERLYELVAADARDQGVRMGEPAPFSNEWVLVADRKWSERTGVTTIGGLADHIDDGDTDFGIALNEDFYHREDAWNGVADYYGIDSAVRTNLEAGTFIVTSAGLTYELLRDGRVQVASGFATDPQLDRPSVIELADDRDYFLPYQPMPTVHAPTAESYPEILETLAPIAAALDGSTIRRLNRRVLVGDQQPGTVARSYLEQLGEAT